VTVEELEEYLAPSRLHVELATTQEPVQLFDVLFRYTLANLCSIVHWVGTSKLLFCLRIGYSRQTIIFFSLIGRYPNCQKKITPKQIKILCLYT
jgi:hypothetical protein